MIRIISDSSTLYSIEEAKKKNIDIAPLSVTINNVTYKENEEINTDEFIKIINEGYMPISSQPSIGEVMNLYDKYPNDEIINITMADGLSGTYNSACMAKNMSDNSNNIEVINSKTLCSPQRYLVDAAANMANSGVGKNEIVDNINNLIKTSKSFLIPKDFNYLVRGGRLSSLAGKVAGIMNLVPVVTLSEDSKKLEKFATCRTIKKAIEKICDNLIEIGVDSTYKIFISHACSDEWSSISEKIIKEKIKDADIEIDKLGPVFTTQGGPGCIAIQTIKKIK